jgi:hypothetical protein
MPRVADPLRLEEAAMMRWFDSCSAGFDQDNLRRGRPGAGPSNLNGAKQKSIYRPERSPPRCSTEIVRVSITLADSYQRRNGYTHRYIVTLRTRRYSTHQAPNATPNVIPSAWSRLSPLVHFR